MDLFHVTSREEIRTLVENGHSVSERCKNCGGTPLFHYHSNPELIKEILQLGANANAANIYGDTALIQSHSLEAMKVLISHGADVNLVNNKGSTALHMGLNEQKAIALLNAGARMDIFNEEGYAAIHMQSKPGVLREFLNRGVDVNMKTKSGKTLHDMQGHSLGFIYVLIESGSDIRHVRHHIDRRGIASQILILVCSF